MIGPVVNRIFADLSPVVASLLLATGPVAAGSYPVPPSEAEGRLAQDVFEILESKKTGLLTETR